MPGRSVGRGQNDYPSIIILEPAPVFVVHSEMGVQSDPEPEPEPVFLPKVIMLDMALQTEPEPIVAKSEMGIQQDAPQPVVPAPPVLVDYGMGTDPVPKPTLVDVETRTKDIQPTPLKIASLISFDSGRRATITQANILHSSTSVENTIMRSFWFEDTKKHWMKAELMMEKRQRPEVIQITKMQECRRHLKISTHY